MFRHLWHHVTGMVRTLRQRVQQASGPLQSKPTTTTSTKKPTQRKHSPVRAVKKAKRG
jgi:hypothetical protein